MLEQLIRECIQDFRTRANQLPPPPKQVVNSDTYYTERERLLLLEGEKLTLLRVCTKLEELLEKASEDDELNALRFALHEVYRQPGDHDEL